MKILPAIFAALIAGLIVFFVQEQRIEKLEDQLALKVVPVSPSNKTNRTITSSSSTPLASTTTKSTRKVKSPEEEPAKEENPVRSMSKIFETEAGKAMIKQGIEAGVPMMYGDFITSLDLSSEEQKYFKGLLTERMMSQQQLGMKWMQADEAGKEELGLQMEQARKENQEQIDEFLQSEEDSTSFQTYEKQLPERQQLAGIRGALIDNPLTPESENQLVETMYQARLNSGEGNGSEEENWQSLAESGDFQAIENRWQKTDEEIARTVPDVLTPDQTESFLAHLKQARAMQKMRNYSGI